MVRFRGIIADMIFPVPKFGEIPQGTLRLQDATDLSMELKVLTVGNTIFETIDRLPEEWSKHVDAQIIQ